MGQPCLSSRGRGWEDSGCSVHKARCLSCPIWHWRDGGFLEIRWPSVHNWKDREAGLWGFKSWTAAATTADSLISKKQGQASVETSLCLALCQSGSLQEGRYWPLQGWVLPSVRTNNLPWGMSIRWFPIQSSWPSRSTIKLNISGWRDGSTGKGMWGATIPDDLVLSPRILWIERINSRKLSLDLCKCATAQNSSCPYVLVFFLAGCCHTSWSRITAKISTIQLSDHPWLTWGLAVGVWTFRSTGWLLHTFTVTI